MSKNKLMFLSGLVGLTLFLVSFLASGLTFFDSRGEVIFKGRDITPKISSDKPDGSESMRAEQICEGSGGIQQSLNCRRVLIESSCPHAEFRNRGLPFGSLSIYSETNLGGCPVGSERTYLINIPAVVLNLLFWIGLPIILVKLLRKNNQETNTQPIVKTPISAGLNRDLKYSLLLLCAPLGVIVIFSYFVLSSNGEFGTFIDHSFFALPTLIFPIVVAIRNRKPFKTTWQKTNFTIALILLIPLGLAAMLLALFSVVWIFSSDNFIM